MAAASAPYTAVVRTTCDQVYLVRDHADPGLSHVFDALPAKRVAGAYVPRAKAAPRLIRRLGCTVLAQVA